MGCSHGLYRCLWLRGTKPDETKKMQKKEFEARQPIQKKHSAVNTDNQHNDEPIKCGMCGGRDVHFVGHAI